MITKDYTKENLDVKHYRNGDPIPFVKSKKKWKELTTGAYCYYDNDPSKGILYNWYAVNDPRGLAPEGWKIPKIEELKLITGLLGGFRINNGDYYDIGDNGYWWSSSEFNTYDAWLRNLSNDNGNAFRLISNKKNGFSVRCLRDEPNLYTVDRHIMFYPKTDKVTLEQLKRFFTDEAIESFIKYGYLKK
jgi:hypothetical protein